MNIEQLREQYLSLKQRYITEEDDTMVDIPCGDHGEQLFITIPDCKDENYNYGDINVTEFFFKDEDFLIEVSVVYDPETEEYNDLTVVYDIEGDENFLSQAIKFLEEILSWDK